MVIVMGIMTWIMLIVMAIAIFGIIIRYGIYLGESVYDFDDSRFDIDEDEHKYNKRKN